MSAESGVVGLHSTCGGQAGACNSVHDMVRGRELQQAYTGGICGGLATATELLAPMEPAKGNHEEV